MSKLKQFLPLLVLGLVVIGLFAPTVSGDFLSWDDDRHLFLNPNLVSGDLWAFWRAPFYGLYIPVIYSVWGFLYRFFEAQPESFHIFNITLHLLNIFLIFLFYQSDSQKKRIGYGLAGLALFALHPLQMESVAWISAGRDLLSAFFALTAVAAFYSERNGFRWILAPILFLAGLLCKPAIITVPLLIWLIQVLRTPSNALKTGLQLLPWGVMALVIFWVSLDTQAIVGTPPVEWWFRPVIMLDSVGFYLTKTFWPFHLNTDYGRSPTWLLGHMSEATFTIFLSLGFTALAFLPWTRKNWREPVLAFWVLLLPVTGLVTFGFQIISTVADHYMYLPMAALGWGLSRQLESSFAQAKINVDAVLALLLVPFLFLISWQRLPIWQSDLLFFEAMAQENPQSFSAHANLGRVYQNMGNTQKAAEHVFMGFKLEPTIFANISNMIVMLEYLGYHDRVIQMDKEIDRPEYEAARQLQPMQWSAMMISLSRALEVTGHDQQAIRRLCDGLKTNPTEAQVQDAYKALQERMARKGTPFQCQ